MTTCSTTQTRCTRMRATVPFACGIFTKGTTFGKPLFHFSRLIMPTCALRSPPPPLLSRRPHHAPPYAAIDAHPQVRFVGILFVVTICHFLYWRFTYRWYRVRALAHPRVQVQMRKLRALKRDAKARAEQRTKPSGRKGKKNRRKSRRKKPDDSDSDSDSDVHVAK